MEKTLFSLDPGIVSEVGTVNEQLIVQHHASYHDWVKTRHAVCHIIISKPREISMKGQLIFIYTWKKVRDHLLCYEGKLWTIIFLQFKYVSTKLLN